ncbi:hypothetical protein [Alkalihalobacterium alkalinitrilicum]|nr:hypothetical protein [Alkalihalobacterium alkalinitrilicum]
MRECTRKWNAHFFRRLHEGCHELTKQEVAMTKNALTNNINGKRRLG